MENEKMWGEEGFDSKNFTRAWVEKAKIWGDLEFTLVHEVAEQKAIDYYQSHGYFCLGTSIGNTRILKNNNTGKTAYMTVKLVNNPE